MSAAILDRTLVNPWIDTSEKPYVIAGPCSAESESQVLETALALSKNPNISAFRAGVWKPRTRPGSFEGIGVPALKWLVEVKKQTGLPVITEVANAWHVEEALKHNIDMLWIGARTTVNPFYVQEIAEALRGVNIPVMVKNPLHPEMSLWMGALERFEKVGISKLAAIHRGFYTHKPAPFRNEPGWDLSFELRRLAPNLPLLCDPSHIAGNSKFIQEISQTAMDINFDGLMIETHNNPALALSDAKQQVTPETLFAILKDLVIKKETSNNSAAEQQLAVLRKEIDLLDRHMLSFLKDRKDIVNKIAEVKKDNKLSIFQLQRWFDIMENRKKDGAKLNLNNELIQELFAIVHKYSVNQQIEHLKNDN